MANAIDAVVLIKADISRADRLARELAQLPGVVEVCFVTGQYDLVARVQAYGPEHLSQMVGEQMSSLEGLKLTETMTALRVHAGEQSELPPWPEPAFVGPVTEASALS